MIGDTKGKPCNVPVICINDNDKPETVPASQWPKQGERYTIIEFCVMKMQGGLIGVRLAETNLNGCYPYEYYNANRFGLPKANDDVEEYLNSLINEPETAQ